MACSSRPERTSSWLSTATMMPMAAIRENEVHIQFSSLPFLFPALTAGPGTGPCPQRPPGPRTAGSASPGPPWRDGGGAPPGRRTAPGAPAAPPRRWPPAPGRIPGELPVPGLLQQPLPRLAQGLAGVGGKAPGPPPLPGRSGSPPAPPTPAGTGGWRSSQSRCVRRWSSCSQSKEQPLPLPQGPGPAQAPQHPAAQHQHRPQGPHSSPSKGVRRKARRPGASWYNGDGLQALQLPGAGPAAEAGHCAEGPGAEQLPAQGAALQVLPGSVDRGHQGRPGEGGPPDRFQVPVPQLVTEHHLGGTACAGPCPGPRVWGSPGARRRRGPGRRPPAPPAGPAPPPFGWGRTAPRTGSGPRPGGRWFAAGGLPGQEQAFTQIRPPEEQGVPQPKHCLGMRNTRLVMSRRLFTRPPSSTAVPHTPARKPPSRRR